MQHSRLQQPNNNHHDKFMDLFFAIIISMLHTLIVPLSHQHKNAFMPGNRERINKTVGRKIIYKMPSIEIVEKKKKIFLNCIFYYFFIFLLRLLVDCNNSHAMLCNQFHNNNSTCTFKTAKICFVVFGDFIAGTKYECFIICHVAFFSLQTFTFSYASFKCLEDLLVLVLQKKWSSRKT